MPVPVSECALILVDERSELRQRAASVEWICAHSDEKLDKRPTRPCALAELADALKKVNVSLPTSISLLTAAFLLARSCIHFLMTLVSHGTSSCSGIS